MMKIEVDKTIVYNEGGLWRTTGLALLTRLNEVAPSSDIPACEPNKEWYQVQQAKKLLGAIILSPSPKPTRMRSYKVF